MLNTILDKYINNERGTDFCNYMPDNISKLLDVMGNPQNKIKTVHVAGTNGKGTICFIISRVLENSGYKTGLFISPHLKKINERISTNSSDISDDELLVYISKADGCATEYSIQVTYFDIITAAAFSYFNDKNIDIAIIETGLGGRLDSTNVIIPEVSIISDISLDHTHILGDTVEKIALEKCGIIKTGVPVITANTDEKILQVIRESAAKQNSELIELKKSYNYDQVTFYNIPYSFKLNFGHFSFTIEHTLFPEHQVKNIAVSVAALLKLRQNNFSNITIDIIKKTIYSIKIPGRFQKLSLFHPVYFDPAHNIESLTSLMNGVKALFPEYKITNVIALMKDKVTPEILALLDNFCEKVIYYKINDPRAYIPENNQFYLITEDRDLIIKELLSDINNIKTVIVFTGTFRLYSFAIEAVKFLDGI